MTDRTPLVGRGAELDRLDEVLDGTAGGRGGTAGGPGGTADGRGGTPGVVDLTGAAGMGKSRLLTEVCGRARTRGLTVLRGRATEYERHIPFRLFTDALADLAPHLLHPWSAEPSLTPVLHGTTPSEPVDRFAVHRAVARMLGALAGSGEGDGGDGDGGNAGGGGNDGGGASGRSGLLIALDDLHWADPASLELLDHLVRHPPHAPVTVVVARRDRQTSPSLAAALTRGVDTGAVLRLDLGPLGERACVEQLAPELAPGRAARLYAASEGNPLYFLTLLQGQAAGPAVPAGGLTALLLDELTPLTATQRRTAEAVAVLGDHATVPLLALTAAAPDPGQLDADLGVLAGRDLLRPGPGGSWSLRHPVLRTVVHENTEHRRRTGMHRRAAAALAGAGAAAAVRAHHVERALTGWDPEAATVLLEAAGQARTTAPASCAHWLGAVLRILPDTPEHQAHRRELLLRRARALSVCGELRESRSLLYALIAQVGSAEDGGLRASAVTLCASMERHLGEYGAAVALLRRELARRPAPRPADALALGLELGSSAPHALSYTEVREDVRRTFVLARRLGNGPAEAGALATSALGETYGGDPATARRLADRAAARVDALTGAMTQALSDEELAGLADLPEPLARLAWTEFYLERYPDAERHADRGLALARRVGPLHLLPHLLLCKAIVHMNTCRLVSALEFVDEAESIARGIGSEELLALVLANKAQVLLAALPPGDGTPLAVAEEAVALSGVRSSWWNSLAWCVLSYVALHGGDPERARSAMLRAGGGPALTHLQPTMRPLFLESLVTSAVVLGDLAGAQAWAARAAADADRLGLPTQRASALRSAGQLLAARGEPGPAADLYARAAAEAARSGAALWESQALLIGSSLAAQSGDPTTATALWHRGRHLADSGGAHLLTGLADLFPPPRPTNTPAPALPTTPTAPPTPTAPSTPTPPHTAPHTPTPPHTGPSTPTPPHTAPHTPPYTAPSAPVPALTAPSAPVPALTAPSAPAPVHTAGPSGAPTPTPAPTPGPLPHLTPRERQIAVLVTEGLTTPAIAARLYLSPRTVDTHLSHIYRKTGVTTRSALAALTARHLP